MGYNLILGCHDCAKSAFVFRGYESVGIRLFRKAHAGHHLDSFVDNGFQPEPWWDALYDQAGFPEDTDARLRVPARTPDKEES